MNRNKVNSSRTQVTGLKKQVQKYDRLQTGNSFLGYSKKKHKYIIRGKRI